MKFIRRVNDTGGVFIPKEIRQIAHIKEGDLMEVHLEGDKVIFQKYEAKQTMMQKLNELERSFDIAKNYSMTACDADKIKKHIKKLTELLTDMHGM